MVPACHSVGVGWRVTPEALQVKHHFAVLLSTR